MTDSKRLSDEIINSGITITAIAKKIGITREGFYKKLNNETEFKASEISLLQDILRLTNKKRDEIFLQKKLKEIQPKEIREWNEKFKIYDTTGKRSILNWI